LFGKFFRRPPNALGLGNVDLEKGNLFKTFFFRFPIKFLYGLLARLAIAGAEKNAKTFARELSRHLKSNSFVRAGDERDSSSFVHGKDCVEARELSPRVFFFHPALPAPE
jgi:hypothetical protein